MTPTAPRGLSTGALRAVSGLDIQQRLKLALEKTRALADRISDLITLSEHNRVIVYSPVLTGQIPRSLAANAFNVFQQSMLRIELVQTCTFWDKPDDTLHHNSILTVHALIDDDEVLETHLRTIQSDWPFGDAQVTDARRNLSELRQQITEVASSPLLARVKNLRDKHLAHALDRTRAEQQGVVEPAKYGDEKALLESTEHIVESLYLWLNGTNFDLAQNRSMHRRHVEELWTNCAFSIPVR